MPTSAAETILTYLYLMLGFITLAAGITSLRLLFLRRARDRFYRILAECLPMGLVYWCAVRALNHALRTQYRSIAARDLKAIDAIDYWHGDALGLGELVIGLQERTLEPQPLLPVRRMAGGGGEAVAG